MHVKFVVNIISIFYDLRPQILWWFERKSYLPVSFSIEKLVSNDTQGPNIHFFIVKGLGIDLRSIVANSPNTRLGRIYRLRSYSKITNHASYFIIDKDILEFDVPMDDIPGMQFHHAWENIDEHAYLMREVDLMSL